VSPGFALCRNQGALLPLASASSAVIRVRVLAPAAALIAVACMSAVGGSAPVRGSAPLALAARVTPALAARATGPDLSSGSAYLAAPANLIGGHYYESFPGYADFGLTMDGAFALAATGDDNPALKRIVAFLDRDGKDPSGNTVNDWTGIGTAFASGGAIGKEALLAEVTGDNPRDFGGHDLIAALDAAVCARAGAGADPSCAAAGNYAYATSVFDQALGIMAQLRAGQASEASAPVAYLESLRNADGSFPSLIPDSGDQDVDSTAMAVMALALAPGARAAADVSSGVAWIARRQEHNGGFPSAGGESVNSAGLAIQALTLQAAGYRSQISAALSFLARAQNANGGFSAYATGPRGSNLRASTQAVGGAVGMSFGTLHRDLAAATTPPPPVRSPAPRPSRTPAARKTVTVTVSSSAARATRSRPPAAAAASTPTPDPSAASAPRVRRALAAAGNDASVATALWRATAAVAIMAAVVIGLLLLRRRRMYPRGSGQGMNAAAGAGPAARATAARGTGPAGSAGGAGVAGGAGP